MNIQKITESKIIKVTGFIGVLILIIYSTAFKNENTDFDGQPIAEYPFFIVDHQNNLGINDVLKLKWTRSKDRAPSFGWHDYAVWIKFEYEKKTTEKNILELRYPLVDQADFYIFKDSKLVHKVTVGDQIISQEFDFAKTVNPSFVFPNEKGFYSVILRVKTTSSIQAPMVMHRTSSFLNYSSRNLVAIGIYAGILLIMSSYNFLIYLYTNRKSHFYYASFVFIFLQVQLALSGYGQVYLWSEYDNLSNDIILTGATMSVWCMFSFTRHWLNLDSVYRYAPYVHKAVYLGMGATVISAWFTEYGTAIRFMAVAVIFGVSYTFGLSCYQGIVKKKREAIFFLIAWTCLIISFFVYLMKQFGLLPLNIFTVYSFQIGSVIEVLLLSLGLADQIETLKQEVEVKNNDLSEGFRRQRQIIGELKKLIYPHQVEAIANCNKSIEETMPIGEGFACVISFDIQRSSAIRHARRDEFFQSVLVRCHKVMMSHYDKDSLKSNAYMIKEMGDGFLCSVGFPFTPPSTIHESSYTLASMFVEIFNEQVTSYFNAKEDVFCGVGIACGKIKGGFPSTGIKKYDLYGDAIVKAVRYESMRKTLFAEHNIKQNNIIIVQDMVFRELNQNFQDELEHIDLGEVSVRDDPGAHSLYFRTIDHSSKNNSMQAVGRRFLKAS